MKRWLITPLLVLVTLMVGCTTPTIRSDVTVFHEWPIDITDKSFVFDRTPDQDNNLEYRTYESLVRNEMVRLGFVPAAESKAAKLKVTLHYSVYIRDVKVVQPVVVDPYWAGTQFYGPRWSGRGYHGPFYNPLWYGVPDVQYRETSFQIYRRALKILIVQRVNNKKLYDVTVDSEGSVGTLASVMPYMIRSAFTEFPAKNGVPRRIEFKLAQ